MNIWIFEIKQSDHYYYLIIGILKNIQLISYRRPITLFASVIVWYNQLYYACLRYEPLKYNINVKFFKITNFSLKVLIKAWNQRNSPCLN
jgi:hypothetical protein